MGEKIIGLNVDFLYGKGGVVKIEEVEVAGRKKYVVFSSADEPKVIDQKNVSHVVRQQEEGD